MKTKFYLTLMSLVLTGVITGCGKTDTKVKQARPVKVKSVEIHSSISSVRYSASIRPSSQVEVAFKVGGYVDAIAREKNAGNQWRYIQAGDVVSKGTVLARIRQSDFVARVNEAKSQAGEARSALETNQSQVKEAIAAVDTYKAQVHDARAAFERAGLDFERAKALFSTQSMTKPDYDAAKAQYEIAKAKLDAAEGNLQAAQAKVSTAQAQIGVAQSKIKSAEAVTYSATIPLDDTELKAPMTAVVLERKVEVGALVGSGTPGFVLADVSEVKAAFGVSDLALPNFKLGDVLNVTSDAMSGREFSGHISRISPSADQTSRVFDVELTIPNTDGALKPGMIASLSVKEGGQSAQEVPIVPLTSITRSKVDQSSYALFAVENVNGKQVARLRTVSLGDSFGNSIAIKSGVKPGEIVVISGVTLLADGDELSVIN
jgi:multidrug efflux system membrane fusion protein